MRTIDADALKKHIDGLPALPDGNFAGNHSALKALINLQPTINPEPRWIPCSERLPEDDGEYLVWMRWDFEDEPSYSIVNYDANAEAFGEWHEYFDKYTLGSLGSDFEEIKGVIAWMPLPEPWKGDEE